VLNPGQKSLRYTTGLPGFYMFGCAFHYDGFGMRTVIIVH
jgi:plastocyanin